MPGSSGTQARAARARAREPTLWWQAKPLSCLKVRSKCAASLLYLQALVFTLRASGSNICRHLLIRNNQTCHSQSKRSTSGEQRSSSADHTANPIAHAHACARACSTRMCAAAIAPGGLRHGVRVPIASSLSCSFLRLVTLNSSAFSASRVYPCCGEDTLSRAASQAQIQKAPPAFARNAPPHYCILQRGTTRVSAACV